MKKLLIVLLFLLSASGMGKGNAAEQTGTNILDSEGVIAAVFATAKTNIRSAVTEVTTPRTNLPAVSLPPIALASAPEQTGRPVRDDRPPAVTNLVPRPRHGVIQIDTATFVVIKRPRTQEALAREGEPSLADNIRDAPSLRLKPPSGFWETEEARFSTGARLRLGPIESPFDRRDGIPPRFGFTLSFPVEKKK